MTMNPEIERELLGAYGRETTDVVRYLLRRCLDAAATVELWLRDGTAGADQSASLMRDLRVELERVAGKRLPGEQVMAYGDGSPITENHQVNDQTARRYLPWPTQVHR